MKESNFSVLPFGAVNPSDESQAGIDYRAVPRILKHHPDNAVRPFDATLTNSLCSDVVDHIAAPRFMSQFGSGQEIIPFGVVLECSSNVDRIASPDHK